MSDIKLIPIDPIWVQKDKRMNIEIAGGIRMRSYYHLDGGGGWMKDFFSDVVTKIGKNNYTRGFEWCSGFGILGFEALGRGQCDHMTFSDYYPAAIRDCLDTAKNNGLSNKVHGYVTGQIGTISENDKWDLVIGNPPHAFGSIKQTKSLYGGMDKSSIKNILRVVCDEGMAIHKEFFTNIKKHLLPDADIFLYEPVECVSSILNELKFIRSCGIDLISQHSIDPYLSAMPDNMDINIHKGGMIMHFKELK
jgi:methylase of polypeptide subunit release factors